jgi:hypothetical protein
LQLVQIEYNREVVRLKNLLVLLELFFQALTESGETPETLRICQVRDGRQLSPYNVACSWSVLGIRRKVSEFQL